MSHLPQATELVGLLMGANDYFVRPDGSLRRGDLGLEVLEREQEILAAKVQRIKDEALPMLKGEGFIVVSPKNPRFDGVEHKTPEEAQEAASELAYQDGRAIIYAPISVVKPKRETAITQPSALLSQIGLTAPSLGAGTVTGRVADVAKPTDG